MDRTTVVAFWSLVFCLFVRNAPANAFEPVPVPQVTDTVRMAQQQDKQEQEGHRREPKAKEGKPLETVKSSNVKPDAVVKDIRQTVKRVPKTRRKVKPISVVPVKPPVKVKIPKLKTITPRVKIKL
ncbi:hypothetical protein [Parapedobacter sp.]